MTMLRRSLALLLGAVLLFVAAGPSFGTDFHVVGTILDRAWVDGDMTQFERGVQTVHVPAGGGAVFESHLLQHCLREINVAAQHFMVRDTAYENLGQFLLGLPDASVMR